MRQEGACSLACKHCTASPSGTPTATAVPGSGEILAALCLFQGPHKIGTTPASARTGSSKLGPGGRCPSLRPAYPAGHGGTGALFELGVRGQAPPDDIGGVVFGSQSWAAFEDKVDEEKLDPGVESWGQETTVQFWPGHTDGFPEPRSGQRRAREARGQGHPANGGSASVSHHLGPTGGPCRSHHLTSKQARHSTPPKRDMKESVRDPPPACHPLIWWACSRHGRGDPPNPRSESSCADPGPPRNGTEGISLWLVSVLSPKASPACPGKAYRGRANERARPQRYAGGGVGSWGWPPHCATPELNAPAQIQPSTLAPTRALQTGFVPAPGRGHRGPTVGQGSGSRLGRKVQLPGVGGLSMLAASRPWPWPQGDLHTCPHPPPFPAEAPGRGWVQGFQRTHGGVQVILPPQGLKYRQKPSPAHSDRWPVAPEFCTLPTPE